MVLTVSRWFVLIVGTIGLFCSQGPLNTARPNFHFTAPFNWINDPNGLFFYKGRYHLFYQHNPFGKDWGHMSWGHASSRDLLQWKHHPLALAEEGVFFYPRMVFSGSVVHDEKNTSGLCLTPECIVAIYTEWTLLRQTQNIAVSQDGGTTFQKYAGNPVLDTGSMSFRDPKVFWHAESRRWIMVVALPSEKRIQFYASKNLRFWEFLSNFGPQGDISGIWECPDLITIDDSRGQDQVLLVSVGETPSGSTMQYFTGRFDGIRFVPDSSEIRRLDYGPDFYAAISFYGLPAQSPVIIGWASNWEYAARLPTHPWRGMMSVPRRLQLGTSDSGKTKLRQIPIAPQWTRRDRHSGKHLAEKVIAIDRLPNTYQLQVELSGIPGRAGIELLSDSKPFFRITYDSFRQELQVERPREGGLAIVEDFYTYGRKSTPLKLPTDRICMNVLVDHGIVEVFAEQGETVFTSLVFPAGEKRQVAVFSEDGRLVSYLLNLEYK